MSNGEGLCAFRNEWAEHEYYNDANKLTIHTYMLIIDSFFKTS